ncbi:MAG: type II secretion system protein [Aquabacterium sp.]
MMRLPASARGFTLVELIMVIVITAVIGTTLSVFLRPVIDSYVDIQQRAGLADQADTSLRRILRDVRRAVPNSLRTPNSNCFELVPASTGGRYRMGPDVTNDASAGCTPGSNCAAYVNTSQPTTSFDVLSTLSVTPSVGDYVVINNQNGNDVYDGVNRSAITTVTTGLPNLVSTQGTARLGINSLQVSTGYNGGRFQVVKSSEQSVFYICSGADGTVNASGNGKGTLYRLVRNFTATYPASCPATASAVPLATNVQSCSFVYDPNQGATLQSGFLWMQLTITRDNESAQLAVGAHVMNVP